MSHWVQVLQMFGLMKRPRLNLSETVQPHGVAVAATARNPPLGALDGCGGV